MRRPCSQQSLGSQHQDWVRPSFCLGRVLQVCQLGHHRDSKGWEMFDLHTLTWRWLVDQVRTMHSGLWSDEIWDWQFINLPELSSGWQQQKIPEQGVLVRVQHGARPFVTREDVCRRHCWCQSSWDPAKPLLPQTLQASFREVSDCLCREATRRSE